LYDWRIALSPWLQLTWCHGLPFDFEIGLSMEWHCALQPLLQFSASSAGYGVIFYVAITEHIFLAITLQPCLQLA
jgi:hypothetical protein